MKLDRRLREYERKRRVEELLMELNLKKCESTRIGTPDESNGISGGERKRLAFASQVEFLIHLTQFVLVRNLSI